MIDQDKQKRSEAMVAELSGRSNKRVGSDSEVVLVYSIRCLLES